MDRLSPIKEILERTGGARYGGENVSQLQHALQCATLAEDAGCDAALITAALLHDIGHLVDQHAEGAAAAGVDRRHEDIGSGYLAKFFGPEVTTSIKLMCRPNAISAPSTRPISTVYRLARHQPESTRRPLHGRRGRQLHRPTACRRRGAPAALG